jgi:vacuolar-type H+-ATPase subunit I/STV1
MDPVTEQTQQTRPLADLSSEELAAFLEEQQSAYRGLEERGLKLDLTQLLNLPGVLQPPSDEEDRLDKARGVFLPLMDKAVTKWVIIGLGVLSALGIFFLNDLHRNPLKNFGSGLWETYNTATGLLGDVQSYLRLYALGLAGAKLGEAFNAIGTQALGDGGVGWVWFILIVVIGHVLNIAMCILGAFVHPLRLNFLEFFKNSGYEGSGRTYKPLKTEES